jgi:hypothetical protein
MDGVETTAVAEHAEDFPDAGEESTEDGVESTVLGVGSTVVEDSTKVGMA